MRSGVTSQENGDWCRGSGRKNGEELEAGNANDMSGSDLTAEEMQAISPLGVSGLLSIWGNGTGPPEGQACRRPGHSVCLAEGKEEDSLEGG